jgi:murein DD-endopeptidase MepM/ murein hydrolase activator NlpD
MLLLWTATPVIAAPPPGTQKQETESLVYTVQPGDTLIGIALRYNLTLAEIALANNLQNPNLILPGQQLILPGIPPLESTTPSPDPTTLATDQFHTVQPGETLFIIANQHDVTIGSIVLANNILDPNIVQVGQTLKIPTGPPPTPEPLPAPFVTVELSEPVIIQGRTLVIKVTLSDQTAALTGNFEGQPLIFWPGQDGARWAIIPIHALAEPDIYPITLTAGLADGTVATTFKNLWIIQGPYGQEYIHLDGSRGELLDAELIQREREKLMELWSRVSPRPRWEGPFRYPVAATSFRVTSYFGTRRNYNGSEEASFHAGTDFGGGLGLPVYASAAGTVALAELLTIRGNAVLLDHGVGLFSGYWHLNQITVTEGQEVQPGELIGYLGNTGLVTGPHLHWEMRLNGIAIEPLQWVQQTIP